MNTTQNLLKKILLLTSILSLTALELQAADYTWTAASTADWASANWAGSPPVDASTGPIDGDNVFYKQAASRSTYLKGPREADTIVMDGTTWTLLANTNSTLKADKIENLQGTLILRNGTSGVTLDATFGNLELVSGAMRLGYSATSNDDAQWLTSLAVSGTTKVTTGTLYLNVRNSSGGVAYSLGELHVNGGTVNLNHSDTAKNVPQVNSTGLSGTGGTINGASNLVQASTNTGTSTLVLTVASGTAYSSGTVLSDGTSGGTLVLTKQGAGTQTLTAASTYSGGTVISAGTLLVANNVGSATGIGNITVGASGALGGDGIIVLDAGNTITVGGILTPGDNDEAALQLNLSGASKLDFASGSSLEMTLGTTSDLITFDSAGNWLDGSGNATLALTQGSGFNYSASYVIFENVTTAGFTLAEVTGYDTINYIHNFTHLGNDYVLSFTAVPEPSIAALSGLAVLSLILRRRV